MGSLRYSARAAVAILVAGCSGGHEPSHTAHSLSLISGDAQTGFAGGGLPVPLVVRVAGKGGSKIPGVSVTFAVTAGGGSLSATTAATDAQGRASVSWTLGTVAGAPQSVTASVAGLKGSPVLFQATAQASSPTALSVVNGAAQTGEVGQPLGLPVTVELADGFGNPVPGRSINWTVLGGGGSPSVASSVSNGAGQATILWTLGGLVGQGVHQLRAQAGALQVDITASGILTNGVLVRGSGNNQLGLAAQALTAPLVARVTTPGGLAVAGIAVTWAVASGGGSLSSAGGTTDPAGQVSTSWTLGATTGVQAVTVSGAGLNPPSLTFNATAVVPQPSSITGSVQIAGATPVPPALPARLWSRPGRSPEPAGRLRAPAGGEGAESSEMILVTYRPAAIGSPGARALTQVTTAQAIGRNIRDRLAAVAVRPAEVTGVSPVIHTARLRITDPARRDSVVQSLRRDPTVVAVQPDLRLRVDAVPGRVLAATGVVPNDPKYPNQSWHYAMLDLPRAWNITTGSAGVIVAVLDNGIVFHHPAIGAPGATYLTGGGNLRTDGYDFVSVSSANLCSGGTINNAADGDGYDPDPSIPDDRIPSGNCLGNRDPVGGHGLHVAGTIGARGNDGVSVTGVNWNVSIRPVRVLGLDGGSYFDIAQGVLYAAGLPADNGHGGVLQPVPPARIINMSLGGTCPAGPTPAPGADPLHDAIVAAVGNNVLVVASAGNGATSLESCPAAYPEVLAVGAVGATGDRASYSNFGSWVDIAAPGGETNAPDATFWVYSSVCDFTVFPSPCSPLEARYAGTSMAAPHVSGVAALLLAQNPGLSATDLRGRLLGYVTPVDPAAQIGAGIVNALDALTQSTTLTRELYVRAYDSATGALTASAAAPGGQYLLPNLPDGSYFVFAGEDESGDGVVGVPDRRFGALGSAVAPAAVAVSSAAGGFASFFIGSPDEAEPNDGSTPNRIVIGGTVRGQVGGSDLDDVYQVQVPAAGTYTFETTGWGGGFCSFALNVNTTLELLDQGQSLIAASGDIDPANNNYCSRISANLGPGAYFLRVTPGFFFDTGMLHSGRYQLSARTGP